MQETKHSDRVVLGYWPETEYRIAAEAMHAARMFFIQQHTAAPQ
jgi:hypothetical protein